MRYRISNLFYGTTHKIPKDDFVKKRFYHPQKVTYKKSWRRWVVSSTISLHINHRSSIITISVLSKIFVMAKKEAKEEEKAAASLEEPRTNPSVEDTGMVRNSLTLSPPKPSWFTPGRYLFFFFWALMVVLSFCVWCLFGCWENVGRKIEGIREKENGKVGSSWLFCFGSFFGVSGGIGFVSVKWSLI